MITKFEDFLNEGIAAPSYNSTITDISTGEQIDPHNWIKNKCIDCGMTRKLYYTVGMTKIYKYYDQMGINRRGNLFCHPGSQKYLPSSDKPIKLPKSGDELNIKPLSKNTSLWDLTKLSNKPTSVMKLKPQDLTDYIKNKKEFNLSYKFLLDLDQSEMNDLEETEKDLSDIRKYLLKKYDNNKDWIELIKSVD